MRSKTGFRNGFPLSIDVRTEQAMVAGTHVAFASALCLGGVALFEYKTDFIGRGLATAASLLPDADLATSKLSRAKRQG
ncbi:MAG: metal-dependent hydrolase [Gammaproteobacteria bacterium]|nr:metal-dependent hydrolase [Gammaproteobacteria bacterium]